MSGKATLGEIETHWTYSDVLKCFLLLNIEIVQIWQKHQEMLNDNS